MTAYTLTRTILILACLCFIALGILGEYKNRQK